MLIALALLLAAALIVLALKSRSTYRVWMLTLVGSLLLALGAEYWIATHPAGHAAEQFAERIESKLLALPWPADERELASLIATFQAFDRTRQLSELHSLFAIRKMHAALNEPVPTYASVAEALRTQQQRRDSAHRSKARNEEFELLQERAVQSLLEVTVPDASPIWPGELASSAPGQSSRYGGEGVWVETKANDRSSHDELMFPVRITNRGDAVLADEQGPILFYLPQYRGNVSGRPHADFGCVSVAIGDLAAGQSKLYKCEIFSSIRKQQTLEERIDLVRQLRAGELKSWVQPTFTVKYKDWLPPATEPLSAADAAEYQALKERDRRVGKLLVNVSGAITCWLAVGVVLLAGLALPGVLNVALPRGRVLFLSIVGGIASLVIVPLAWRAGSGDGWAPLVYAMAVLFADGVFVTGLLLGNLLIAKGAPE